MIDHDMERIGRLMAADQSLTVECRGVMAYATRGRVVIPSLENLDHLGDDAERMMHGYLDHECAHAIDSDFDLFEKAAARSASFKELLNALEDGRIERDQGIRFHGSKWNLAQKNRWFWDRKGDDGQTSQDEYRDPTTDPWRKLTLALTLCARPYGGREIEDFQPLCSETFDRLELCRGDLEELATIAGDNAPQEVWAIAERIWERFDQKTQEENDGATPEGLQINLQGRDAEGEALLRMIRLAATPEAAVNRLLMALLDGEDLGDKTEAVEEGREEADEEDEHGTSLSTLMAALPRSPSGDRLPSMDHPGQNHKIIRSDRPYIVFSREYDLETDYTGDLGSSNHYDALVEASREAADAFVQAFEAALFAQSQRSASYGHDNGEIDPDALAEFSVGGRSSDTLYMQHTASADHMDGVAVSILVDCSGSMGGYDYERSKARLAAMAATALHRACASCDIEHEVLGFTTASNGRWGGGEGHPPEMWEKVYQDLKEAERQGQKVEQFARITMGCSVEDRHFSVPSNKIFKRFGSSDARAISRITGSGANLDGESVTWAARRLAERPESRRVLFVLSDGLPSGAGGNADEAGYLRETVARVIDAGIEVYGIGIMSEAVEEFYPIQWVANSIGDLPRIAVEALVDVLSTNRQERECVQI